MKQQAKRRGWATAALFLTAVIWGGGFLVVKTSTDVFPPAFLLAIRFSLGCLALAAVFAKRLRKIDKALLWRGALLGTFLFLGYYIQTVGIMDTTPGKSAFLTAIYCILVPFLYGIVDQSRPEGKAVAAAVLGVAGIGVISLDSGLAIGRGDALTLVSGVFFAVHVVSVARLSRGQDVIVLTILQFAAAAALSWVTGLLTERFPVQIPPSALGGMAFLGFVATALGLLLQNVGQKYTHPAAASLILSLESVFGALFSVAFYGEQATPQLLLGFGLVFAAILLSQLPFPGLHRRGTALETGRMAGRNER